jgi:hypothetical protein
LLALHVRLHFQAQADHTAPVRARIRARFAQAQRIEIGRLGGAVDALHRLFADRLGHHLQALRQHFVLLQGGEGRTYLQNGQ